MLVLTTVPVLPVPLVVLVLPVPPALSVLLTTTEPLITVAVTVAVLIEGGPVTVFTTVFVCAKDPTDATWFIAYPEMNTMKRTTTRTLFVANFLVLLEELNIIYRFTNSS